MWNRLEQMFLCPMFSICLLLHLQIQIGENRNLDRTRLGKDLVLVKQEVVAGGEVLDGDAHDAIEMLIHFLNTGAKFLPEDLLL